MTATALVSLRQCLPADLALDEPDIAGALTVFPVLGSAGPLRYLSLASGAAAGVKVRELPGASVNDLVVDNPLGVPVLLYEGEELLGAQQNRTVDHAVLLAPATTTTIGVSCVEHGRWEATRHSETMRSSPNAAFPELRRHKSQRMRARLAAGLEARADQGEVWDTVRKREVELQTDSPTGAMSDLYVQRADELDRHQRAIRRRPGQLGSLVAIGGRFVVLDLVSRPEVYADLQGPLVAGYALDALDEPAKAAPLLTDAQAWLDDALEQVGRRTRVRGMGDGMLVDASHVGGTGLVVDDHLVQLCLYGGDDAPSPSVESMSARIRRPSRRR
jgi:hypothetical protein